MGPHTISVPRVRRADDIDPDVFDNGISDDIFAKIVACIRIAVPYTGMIVSTRESKECRRKVLELGISQISGGSRTSVGGYVEPEEEEERDAKSRLQEFLQAAGETVPRYQIVAEEGPPHARVFTAEVLRAGGELLGRGEGVSKKRAEQQAAQQALERLTQEKR